MKQSKSIKAQTGDFLIESLIGMVLMAIIGMGIVEVSSRAAVAQHDMRIQEIVVNKLRALLIQNKMGAVNICTTTPTITLPNNANVVLVAQGCGANSTTTASIGGKTVTGIPKPISLKATITTGDGDNQEVTEIVVGGTWESN